MAIGSKAFGIADAAGPLVETIGAVLATARAAIAAFAVVLFSKDKKTLWR